MGVGRRPIGKHAARASCVTFCMPQKVTFRLPRREFRGFANLESAHRNGDFAGTKLTPWKPKKRMTDRIRHPLLKIRTYVHNL